MNNEPESVERAEDRRSELNTLLSSGRLGWQIRTITHAKGENVTFEDGVSFGSPCFAGAQVGDIWAVRYEMSSSVFGKIRQAILLQPVGR